jgi:cytochrome c-L
MKYLVLIFICVIQSCSKEDSSIPVGVENDSLAQISTEETVSTQTVTNIKLVKTTDGSEIKFLEKALVGTDAEKEFLKTGKNIYVGDAEAVAAGKKRYNMWSCTQCHGPTAKGQVGPGLTGPKYNYAKDATNKGMFETIWAGTNGGMGGKGYGIMAADDGTTVDEMLKIIAFIRSNSKDLTGNEGL